MPAATRSSKSWAKAAWAKSTRYWIRIGEKIALKLLKPEISSDEETIARFRNELKVARTVTHKNVCRMYDFGRAEGTYFITMEYVPGEDLKSTIARVGS